MAGFVDAIVGGGGLVLTPALFAVYPLAVPATLLGTSKGGPVWWHLALLIAIAIANVSGSLLGLRLALKHGAGFVRGVFIVVVGGLIVKTGYDAFFR